MYKIAIVTDDLIQFGGQERLVAAVSEIWPEASIYTSVISKKWRKYFESKKVSVISSFVQFFPFITQLNRFYSPFLVHAVGLESFDLTQFDVVLSISSRYAHFVITKPRTLHICYMNTPGRMFWEPIDYFKNENFGKIVLLRKYARFLLQYPLSFIRALDFAAAQRVNYFIANAKTPQDRIKKYYKRNSHIIYPFVDYAKFVDAVNYQGDYFVIVTRLVAWKRVDIAIEACNALNLPLKIVGSGPDLKRLKNLAGPTIEFLGYISEDAKKQVLAGCKAFIQTQYEDFGISILEPMACGKPVIAFGKGGALETVVSGKTGEFFYEQSSLVLQGVLQSFNPKLYEAQNCKAVAKKFDKQIFVKQVKNYVDNALQEEAVVY